MPRFLVATDLSPRSDRAVNRALALADEFNATLTVLHVVDSELPFSAAGRHKAEAEAVIDDQLDAFPTLRRENIVRKVVLGSEFKSILKVADEGDVNLIILGVHRDESIGDLFRGTTAERIIRRGIYPVLVAKNRMKEPYHKVLVGIDFSVYSRRAVEFAFRLVPHGEIHLVHAFERSPLGFRSESFLSQDVKAQYQKQVDAMLDEELQAFLKTFDSAQIKLKPKMIEGLPTQVILDQVKQLRPDLLVVGTHGRTGVARASLGSVAESLLSEPPCDVLAVKAW